MRKTEDWRNICTQYDESRRLCRGHVKCLLCNTTAIKRGLGILYFMSYVHGLHKYKPNYKHAMFCK